MALRAEREGSHDHARPADWVRGRTGDAGLVGWRLVMRVTSSADVRSACEARAAWSTPLPPNAVRGADEESL